MGLRTVDEFVDSLRDGRTIYFGGERVRDVTTHPFLRIGVMTAAADYELAHRADTRDLFTVSGPDGERISRFFHPPRSTADLLRRRDLIEAITRHCLGMPSFAKEGGSDALHGITVASALVDEACKTGYHARVLAFREMVQQQDLSLAIAMTDVKGDRGLRPSQQQDPDLYVRVVDRNARGIVVRGAKAHISSAPQTNWILVLPTRAMADGEADWAVAFAVPANAPGLIQIARPGGALDAFDHPIAARYEIWESVLVFDDVFIPWENVFLCGEWQHAGLYALMFSNFHRFTAAAYKYAAAELLAGAAIAMAEYNGIEAASHVREKISWLIMYAETIRALTTAAANTTVTTPVQGMVYPDPIIANAAKFYFADQYHQAIKHLQDIAGGITVTIPGSAEFTNPTTARYLEKYLAGNARYPTMDRVRMIKLVKELTASDPGGFWLVTSLHAEGSLAAEKLVVYREADRRRYFEVARRAAGITE